MAPGSQTFEQDLIRLVTQGYVSRDEAVAYADSPANLLWKLQNVGDTVAQSLETARQGPVAEVPAYTSFAVDVRAPVQDLPPVRPAARPR